MMQELWKQIEVELEKLAPTLLTQLHSGADEATIARAEQLLGVLLPEEVKAFFREHNGSAGSFFGHWTLLSLQDASQEWLARKAESASLLVTEEDASLRTWNLTWFPLMRTDQNDGPLLFLKLGSTEIGQEGWVFQQYQNEPFNFSAHPVFHTLYALLERTLEDLRTGGYRYDSSTERLCATRSRVAFDPEETILPFYESLENQPRRINYPGLACLSSERYSARQNTFGKIFTLEQSGERIEKAMTYLAPGISQEFEPIPSLHTLQEIERELQVEFPEDLKLWYTHFNYTTRQKEGFLDWFGWSVLEDVHIQWELKQEGIPEPVEPIPFPYPESFLVNADPRIQTLQWHPHWIPFMSHIDGMFYCVDLAPTEQGQYGQVILPIQWGIPYCNDQLDTQKIPPTLWVAPSLRHFLAALARDLEAGHYTYDERSGMLWSQEGLDYIEEDLVLQSWLAERRREFREERKRLSQQPSHNRNR